MNEEQWDATKTILLMTLIFEAPLMLAGYLLFGLSEAGVNAMFCLYCLGVGVMICAGWKSRRFRDKALSFRWSEAAVSSKNASGGV